MEPRLSRPRETLRLRLFDFAEYLFAPSALWLGLLALSLLSAAPLSADTMISDNSFLIEEAYNQEAGIVQHIFTGEFPSFDASDAFFSFTQEWPLTTQRHQGSFTLPFSFLDQGSASGFGDLLLNYRLQLGAIGVSWAAAPRVSLVLPTGDENEGRGGGVVGAQLALPLSFEITPRLAIHANAGFETLPGVEGFAPRPSGAAPTTVERTLVSPFGGASAVFPIDRRVQALVEFVVSSPASIGADGEVERATETVVSPGLRAAIDRGGVQIVPGIAFPMTFSDGESDAGLFFYLSLEHAFRGRD